MVIKRNKIWYTDFRFNGCRIRRSTKTTLKKEAEKFAHNLRTKLYSQHTLGERPRRTWKDAVVRYSREAQFKRSWADIQRHLVYFDKKLGQLYLDEITNDVIEEIIDEKLSEGITGATVNRYTTTLRTVLRKACNHYEWIQKVPMIRKLPESEARLSWLTHEEYDRLITELPKYAAQRQLEARPHRSAYGRLRPHPGLKLPLRSRHRRFLTKRKLLAAIPTHICNDEKASFTLI